MCAILISKALRLICVNEESHNFTCHPHVYPHVHIVRVGGDVAHDWKFLNPPSGGVVEVTARSSSFLLTTYVDV